MKQPSSSLSRRQFLVATGAMALAAKAAASAVTDPVRGFAYALSQDAICVYSVQGASWTEIQALPGASTISLALDRAKSTLHLLHDVAEYRGLPRGYIASYAIDTLSGRLTDSAHQPLSLSAIHPAHLALSPDGHSLAVAIRGGSAYNLLPVGADGLPRRPFAIRKETGFDLASPSRPSQVLFHADGSRLFALDAGTSSLSLLACEPEMPLLSRLALPRGASFSHLAWNQHRQQLYMVDTASGNLHRIELQEAANALSLASTVTPGTFLGPLAVAASAQTLFAAASGRIQVFRILESGALEPLHSASYPQSDAAIHALSVHPSANALHVAASAGIWQSEIDPASGRLSSFMPVAPSARALAFL